MTTSSRYLPILPKVVKSAIIGGVTGSIIGYVIGYVIDNWHLRGEVSEILSRWICRIRSSRENRVTGEWQALTSLIDDDRDLENSPPPGTGNPIVSCRICYDLMYDSPHLCPTPGVWKTRGTGWYDYFIEDLSCPYPQTRDWVASAMRGCVPCQIVVDAVSSYSPQIFKDCMPDLDGAGLLPTHIRAWTSPGKPLMVSVCRPWLAWQSEREEHLEVFTKVGSPLCWPTVASAHPVCSNNWDTQAIEKISRWLDACYRKHGKCSQRTSGFVPKRLIEINDAGEIRLIEPEASHKYVALSYCWGTRRDHWLMTLNSTIAQHMQSIDKERLPQGLADAIVLAKALNFHFIWIDALCIIQDDPADLKSELVRMGRLYACADLVIGIDTTKDCTVSNNIKHAFAGSIYFGDNGHLFKKTFQSTFDRRRQMTWTSWFQQIFDIKQGRASIPPLRTHYEPHFSICTNENALNEPQQLDKNAVFIDEGSYSPRNVDSIVLQPRLRRPSNETLWNGRPKNETILTHEQPDFLKIYVREAKTVSHGNGSIKRFWKHLDTRGWTLQESLLAKRMLTLGVAEMKWTCVEESFCECFEPNDRVGRDSNVSIYPIPESRREELATKRLQTKQTALLSSLTSEGPTMFCEDDLFEAWELLIEEYSKRNLSKIGDRLPAITGIAAVFNEFISRSGQTQNQMLAGLWKENLLKGMLWHSIDSDETHPPELVYGNSIPVPENTRVNRIILLEHLRLSSLSENRLIFDAYVGGKPCYANTIYWPIIERKLSDGVSWPTEYFPSWSWLSVMSTVTYWNLQTGSPEALELSKINDAIFVEDAKLVSANTWISNQWTEGITSGKFTLHCRISPVKLKSVLHRTRASIGDFGELYQLANFDQDQQALPFLIPPLLRNFTHFAYIDGTSALMLFIPDTPCVFGANEPSGEPSIVDNNQWLIDLIKQEHLVREREKAWRVSGNTAYGPVENGSIDMDGDFHKFMPCMQSQSTAILKSESLCSDNNCGCKKRWSDSSSYPAVAAYIGSYYIDDESGKRSVHRFSLILMPSLHHAKAFHRIGIAVSVQFPGLPGYCDPFKGSIHEKIDII